MRLSPLNGYFTLFFWGSAMPETLRIECPHCSTKLNAKNPAILGKKVKCPKCAEPFVAQSPRAPTEDEFFDNLDSMGDGFGDVLPSSQLPAAPKRAKKPRASTASGSGPSSAGGRPTQQSRPRGPQVNTMPMILWPLFGLGGGIIAGIIWVMVGYFFQREVGYIAWAVGGFVGVGIRIAAGDRAGIGAGLLAIAVSIFVILGCKFTVAYMLTAKFVNHVAQDVNDDGAKFMLAMQMETADALQEAAAGRKPTDHNVGNATTFDELPKNVQEKTEKRWKKMTAAEKQEVKNQVNVVAKVPTVLLALFAFIASFRILDVLWFGLASFTAFRVSRSS
jgi:predicted Zn finger-like uncharacterized protein